MSHRQKVPDDLCHYRSECRFFWGSAGSGRFVSRSYRLPFHGWPPATQDDKHGAVEMRKSGIDLGTVACVLLAVVVLIPIAICSWEEGKHGPFLPEGGRHEPTPVVSQEIKRLHRCNRWAQGLHSRSRKRTRETISEMQAAGFSQEHIDECTRLWNKYGRR